MNFQIHLNAMLFEGIAWKINTIKTKCVKYEGVLLNWVGKHSDFFFNLVEGGWKRNGAV